MTVPSPVTGQPVVLYAGRVDLSTPAAAGVARKMRAQASAMVRALGGAVQIVTPEAGRIATQTVTEAGNEPHTSSGEWSHRRLHAYAYYLALARAVEKAAAGRSNDLDLRRPDILYLRYQRVSPPLLALLRRARRALPHLAIIVEVPTWAPNLKAKGWRGAILRLSDRVWRKRAAPMIDLFVTFTPDTEILGVRALPISNGISSELIPSTPPPAPPEDGPLRLLGLANISFWHGYDRVIEGLAASRKAGASHRPVLFEVVGGGAELENLMGLANKLGVDDIVRFHGPLGGAELSAVTQTCHIGIGAVAMHRVGIGASALKSREFCALGLPFIFDHEDPDFGGDFPFAMKIAGTDDPLEIPLILSFYDGLAARPDYAGEMRQYARENLTWDVKMAPVFKEISRRHRQEARP